MQNKDFLLHLYPDQTDFEAVSFEKMIEIMSQMDGMFVEMDGSFVWIDRTQIPHRQMDGMIYDHEGRLVYVEIKGNFSLRQFQLLCDWVSHSNSTQLNDQKNHQSANENLQEGAFDFAVRIHCPIRQLWFTMSDIEAMIEA